MLNNNAIVPVWLSVPHGLNRNVSIPLTILIELVKMKGWISYLCALRCIFNLSIGTLPRFKEMTLISLQWRYNGYDGISNHQRHDCLLNHLFKRRSKKQSSASLAFVREIHRGPVNSPHKWPVMRKMFPFDDVIMCRLTSVHWMIFTDICSWFSIIDLWL